MIVPDAVVNDILPVDTVIPFFASNVPLIIVAYPPLLPIFIVLSVGTPKSVSVPIFIPPDAVASTPINIGPVVRVAVVDPHPKYYVPVV